MTAAFALSPAWGDFGPFAVARRSHWERLGALAPGLYGHAVDPDLCDLKPYQDLLVLAFIRDNLPPGSRLLEIGGGNSRVLAHLADSYECWNIDKFEGVGNGPLEAQEAGYAIVRDYIGNFSPELADGYFDLVFSISTLEHVPDAETAGLDRVIEDMDRVLRPGGLSLHCLDVLLKADEVWTNRILPRIHETRPVLHAWTPLAPLLGDPEVYCMTRQAYEAGWQAITGQPYDSFGRPTSCNVLWRKPQPQPQPQSQAPALRSGRTSRGCGLELPRISVVTPSFNQGEYLEECMDSLLSQGYPNLEYIVMDGGSSDGSVEIIKRRAKHLAHWRSGPDQGQYWAVNEGLGLCTGECMGWLNSDDKHHPASLFVLAAIFTCFPEVRWLMACPTVWDEQGALTMLLEPLPLWDRRRYLRGEIGPPHVQQESTFWRRSLWDEAGGRLDTAMGYAGDMELWSRFFRREKLFVADALVGGFRLQRNSKTSLAMDAYDAEAAAVVAREADLARAVRPDDVPAPAPILLEEILRRCPDTTPFTGLARAYRGYAEALAEPRQAEAMLRRAATLAEFCPEG
ncbi:glycosyl transferase family 2 [Desulfovibrio sp. X2]|uniref:glycosyltransferase n=1 Tax=Desulfovibrio sp. X2 TaxID=941449 RepID=UPI000358B9D4|nr:glycosyltransferase [Desulfovibrio sp. X2]EPR37185.1 glycosyl transferase family 2 [Desulfovibrio sp. X2]